MNSSNQNEQPHEESSLKAPSFPGICSLTAGAAGGVCSVLVGYPFDLVKVRSQTADRAVHKNAWDVFKSSLIQKSAVRVCQP